MEIVVIAALVLWLVLIGCRSHLLGVLIGG